MSLKILHTADWHIGKKLYDYSLADDHRLFFDDLLNIINDRSIDYLIIAGDVFDLANPSNESLELYYSFITRIIPTGCKLIITGGNHDSPGVLNAPKNILQLLNISVTGCATNPVTDEIIPMYDKQNKLACIIAAVPYLRDRDLRISSEGSTTDQRIEEIRNGIKNHYARLADFCSENFPGIPAIAAGHLYIQNAELSDSERDIQIGNLAGVSASAFPDVFRYVALGHIHKPQNVGSERIRYSGSPIPLSFSERNYRKRIILLEVEDEGISQEEITLTPHRQLELMEGTLEEIQDRIIAYRNELNLPALIEIRIQEKNYDPVILRSREALDELLKKNANAAIIQFRVSFTQTQQEISAAESDDNFSELEPVSLWKNLISEYPPEKQKELEQAFLEIMQSSTNEPL